LEGVVAQLNTEIS